MEENIRVLIITNGGERKCILQCMFEDTTLAGFDVDFIDGIQSRDLKSRNKTEVIVKHLIDGASYDYDAFWRIAKRLDFSGRCVLSCALAHMNAWAAAEASGTGHRTIILEDNVRAFTSRPHADGSEPLGKMSVAASAVAETLNDRDAAESPLLFVGYLGSEKAVRAMHRIAEAEREMSHITAAVQVGVDAETGAKFDLLWGAYAYRMSRSGAAIIMDHLRKDLGALVYTSRKKRYAQCKPIDKTMLRVLLHADCPPPRVSCTPIFFRAPMLQSRIHPQFDIKFAEATWVQLQLKGFDCSDLWLPDNELAALQSVAAGGLSSKPSKQEDNAVEDKVVERQVCCGGLKQVTQCMSGYWGRGVHEAAVQRCVASAAALAAVWTVYTLINTLRPRP